MVIIITMPVMLAFFLTSACNVGLMSDFNEFTGLSGDAKAGLVQA